MWDQGPKGKGEDAAARAGGWGRGWRRRVRNPAQIEMELISWRASAVHQALDFKSRVRHLIAPAVARELLFPQ